MLVGDFVRLSVTDTGSGMSEEVRARVFEPFCTTKEVGKGSGLGLAPVYGSARQSGGTVQLQSNPGEGSSISLLLPWAGVAVSAVVPEREHHAKAPASGCVLLVEDDLQVATLVTDMLDSAGYRVVSAASADAALDLLASDSEVDFMLSDIMLSEIMIPGGTSGMDVARQVRSRRPDLPILLGSGFAEPSRVEASRAGIDILAKPYSLQELQAAMLRTRSGKPADCALPGGRASC